MIVHFSEQELYGVQVLLNTIKVSFQTLDKNNVIQIQMRE
jgi:hypothetical protein